MTRLTVVAVRAAPEKRVELVLSIDQEAAVDLALQFAAAVSGKQNFQLAMQEVIDGEPHQSEDRLSDEENSTASRGRPRSDQHASRGAGR